MAGTITIADLDALIAKGVTRATFHENGTLASIDLAPALPQHDAFDSEAKGQPVKPARSATGRLVPRVERQ